MLLLYAIVCCLLVGVVWRMLIVVARSVLLGFVVLFCLRLLDAGCVLLVVSCCCVLLVVVD